MIITNSPTQFNVASFIEWLYDNGFNDNGGSIENNNKRYWVCGAGQSAYVSMISAPARNKLRIYSGSWMQGYKDMTSLKWFTDTVQQII